MRLALHHGEPIEDETITLRWCELSIHTKIKQRERAIGMKEDVARMEVGMKKSVGHEHLKHDIDQEGNEALLFVLSQRTGCIVQAQPLHPVHGQHPPAGMVPMNLRKFDVRATGEVCTKAIDDLSLSGEIQLLERVAAEFFKEAKKIRALHPARGKALQPAQSPFHGVQIATDQALKVWPLNLDRDSRPVKQRCPVNLRQRGCGCRRLVKGSEQIFDRLSKVALNDEAHLLGRYF